MEGYDKRYLPNSLNSGSQTARNETLDSESFAKLAENRSIYGNYLDNSLVFDPYKDKKSVYDVVYKQDIYDPWGKPGGGAPLFNKQTGKLKTKIEGSMQWNLNGETLSAKSRSKQTNFRQGPNLVEFKKTPDLIKLPLNNELTTYRQVFGGIDNNNNLPQPSQRNVSPNRADSSYLEKQAELRNWSRHSQKDLSQQNANSYISDSSINNFNNLENFRKSKQTIEPPNYAKMWFGRPGGGAPGNDTRRTKLYEALEHRNNQEKAIVRSQSEFNYNSQIATPRSTHKILYDNYY